MDPVEPAPRQDPSPEPAPPAVPARPLGRLRTMLFGAPRDVQDPRTHHSISLIALLAWVGLGADGLSSSAYGPDEAFRELGNHGYLAIAISMVALPSTRNGARNCTSSDEKTAVHPKWLRGRSFGSTGAGGFEPPTS